MLFNNIRVHRWLSSAKQICVLQFIFKMRVPFQIAVSLFTAQAATTSFGYPPITTVQASTSVAVTSSPTAWSTQAIGSSEDYMTILMTNRYGTQVSLSFGSDIGYPSPVGDPSPTILPDASPTHYTFPRGWAGRICVGPNLNPNGSKIEGSFIDQPYVDISLVDGYTVPMTCSSEGVVFTGCNVELFDQPNVSCDDLADGPVCLNSAITSYDGPAPPFFAICAGAAYTFSTDDSANRGIIGSNLIICCIGSLCPAPARQMKTQEKRVDRKLDRGCRHRN